MTLSMQRGQKHRNSEGAYWRAGKLRSNSCVTCGLLRESIAIDSCSEVHSEAF